MMTGRSAASGSFHFRAFNDAGLVWQTTTSTFVTWVDGNWANYQIAATATGGGWYAASTPSGAVRADLCITGATLADSPSVWVWEAAAGGGGSVNVNIGETDVQIND